MVKLFMVKGTKNKKELVLERFLKLIGPLKKEIKTIYLFVSRFRNNWRAESDYNILIILERKNKEPINKLYDIVIDILIDTGRLISLKIFTKTEFDCLKSILTPFVKKCY